MPAASEKKFRTKQSPYSNKIIKTQQNGLHQTLLQVAHEQIIDIRSSKSENNPATLKQSVADGLNLKSYKPHAETAHALNIAADEKIRTIPTMVLYDDKGLDIYDKITYVEDYYLTNAEIDIFQNHAAELVGRIPDNAVLIELGVGSMRKTKYIFAELVRQNKHSVTYLALDLSLDTLRASVKDINAAFPSVKTLGLWGTYNDSLKWVNDNIPKGVAKIMLWLGSSIGNMTRPEASDFFSAVRNTALDVGDTFVVGIDRRNDAKKIELAYNDSLGITRDFIMNGLVHVNTLFGGDFIDPANFEYVSRYNVLAGQHEAYYRSLTTQTLKSEEPYINVTLEAGELINIEYSVKYSMEEVDVLAEASQFYHLGSWADTKEQYNLHVFQKPPFFFLRSQVSLMKSAPSVEDFKRLWSLWDTVTGMIPTGKYLARPIALRHPFIFYFGHIPAFLDIQISRCLEQPFTEPCYYTDIFERGIDPDMEDPSKCHPHSEVPNEWPNVEEIFDYRDRVRARILNLVEDSSKVSKRLARTLFMCYEHEAMHCETFLYMLVQYPHVLPPKGISAPITRAPASSLPAPTWTSYTGGDTILGADDSDDYDLVSSSENIKALTWDNERPAHVVNVKPFSIQDRPVVIEEYFNFLVQHGGDGWQSSDKVPASWSFEEGGSADQVDSWRVKTVFGKLPLKHALHWPVSCSVEQASAYAVIQGRRLPTETEIAHIRNRVFITSSSNMGFLRWCPREVEFETGVVGNGWEMTSTKFEPFDGFEASALYPGYSADFFDDKHNVLVGGSWATVPTIAARKSFRNWYQTGYPYVFGQFRLAL
ncbi:hypothetical protein SmJEL517_g01524 [Synchytrium microbalum]|uniref:Dimethylhistidine N-methyltransferase n=1 Tax=Synchytrium microbalum TaxID=1806994 RepID=A0A507CAI6_9FUNG|nr:uncharacterized protein SmJEL517_g01524 [Synchytrium microbalum]TPX36358.1 hypothetical protein SmJEL517_g01524 [Synchytrium microbalum]